MHIRGGTGLGDSLYLRVIAEHFIRQGKRVTAHTYHPDVFIGSGALTEPFRRDRMDLVAHYTLGKTNYATSQWQDICAMAKVPDMPLRFDWTVRNTVLMNGIMDRAAGRKIILVHGGREPMNRVDGFARELMPAESAFRAAMDALADCLTIRIGAGKTHYKIDCEIDLSDQTTASDLLDLAFISDGILAQCSFAIPLAEVFDKPMLMIWSQLVATARYDYVRQITPKKVLSGPRSTYLIDNLAPELIRENVAAWL